MQSLRKTVRRFLKKLKNRTAICSSNSTSEENKMLTGKETYAPMFIAALFSIAKPRKKPKRPSLDEWVKNIYYSAIKRKDILPIATTWIDHEGLFQVK